METLKKENVIKALSQNDFLDFWFDEPNSLLILRWKRQISFEERVIGYEQAYGYAKQYLLQNILIDNENIFLFSAQEKEWLTKTLAIWIKDTNLRKFALVTSDVYKNMADIAEFIDSLKENNQILGQVEQEFFIDYSTAYLWLTGDIKN